MEISKEEAERILRKKQYFEELDKKEAERKEYVRKIEKERCRKYYLAHKEEINARQRKYRADNYEKVRAREIEYRRTHRDEINRKAKEKYRAKKGLPPDAVLKIGRGNRSLTDDQVREIKAIKDKTCKEIGEMYGVKGAVIASIKCGRTYKDVE